MTMIWKNEHSFQQDKKGEHKKVQRSISPDKVAIDCV